MPFAGAGAGVSEVGGEAVALPSRARAALDGLQVEPVDQGLDPSRQRAAAAAAAAAAARTQGPSLGGLKSHGARDGEGNEDAEAEVQDSTPCHFLGNER